MIQSYLLLPAGRCLSVILGPNLQPFMSLALDKQALRPIFATELLLTCHLAFGYPGCLQTLHHIREFAAERSVNQDLTPYAFVVSPVADLGLQDLGQGSKLI